MQDINITIRYNGEKNAVSTQDNIILEDLLQQLAGRGTLPPNQNWVVTKMGDNAALDLGATLVDNGVADGDILDLGLPTKAGAKYVKA